MKETLLLICKVAIKGKYIRMQFLKRGNCKNKTKEYNNGNVKRLTVKFRFCYNPYSLEALISKSSEDRTY